MENKSSQQIIEEAYLSQYEEEYWQLISELHRRGSFVEFEHAERLCQSRDPIYREIGADILGQLGWQAHVFHNETITILMRLLSDDHPDVIASAAYALGHRKAEKSIPLLIKHKNHPNVRVRNSIVFGLLTYEDTHAIQALIELSEDLDENVRDWATFGLGSMIESDSFEIKHALEKRLSDPNGIIRGEAYVGLAKRDGIKNILTGLIAELSDLENCPILMFEAAEILKAPQLYPSLEKMYQSLTEQDSKYYKICVEDALKSCMPQK